MKYALLFPGQGSQSVGMLSALSAPEVADTFKEASEILGWDLTQLVQQGPEAELNRTERTQPALLAAGVAVWRAWSQRCEAAPFAVAGHSLGEYTALVAAGSLAFADALKLVELRGQLMQAAVPEGTGGMVALLGLSDDAVVELCAQCPLDAVLEPANFNSPGQVVVAGQTEALDWLLANARSHGAKIAKKLAMSVPSHCSLLSGAAGQLFERLQQIDVMPPKFPVLHNLDAAARGDADDIRAALRDQLSRPVRWTQTVQQLVADGAGSMLECGPGKVLSGLMKRIAADTPAYALENDSGFEAALQQLGISINVS